MSREIDKLEAVTSISGSEIALIFDESHGDTRTMTMADLLSFIQDNLEESSISDVYARQIATVISDAFVVSVMNTGEWVWLKINMDAVHAGGTVIFPLNPVDQQQLLITVSHNVTSPWLAANGNGHSLEFDYIPTPSNNYETSMWKFDEYDDTWYRIL